MVCKLGNNEQQAEVIHVCSHAPDEIFFDLDKQWQADHESFFV